jgi:hypothetical protein
MTYFSSLHQVLGEQFIDSGESVAHSFKNSARDAFVSLLDYLDCRATLIYGSLSYGLVCFPIQRIYIPV